MVQDDPFTGLWLLHVDARGAHLNRSQRVHFEFDESFASASMGKKEMAVRYSYLALEEDHRLVAEWFSALPEEVTVSDGPDRVLFYFHAMATKPLPTDGTIDQQTTPLVFVEKPRKKRGTLWTDAEVYFTPSPLKRQFPTLGKISQSFEKWLRGFDLVFAQKNAAQSKWTYYLEAGIQNYCEEVYALPEAMAALRSGQYFVHHRASAGALDTLARSLRLRGYHAEPA